MKYIVILSLFLISVTSMAANNDPTSTTTNFYKALKTNNISVARTLIVNPDNLPDDGTTSFDIEKYYLLKSNTIKNIATVQTSTVNSKGTLLFNTVLKYIKGKWKVDFNKTIMNMARGAVKKKQVGGKIEINIEQK